MNVSSEEPTWRRTSPVAVIFFVFSAARQFLVNGLPIIALGVGAAASRDGMTMTLIKTGLTLLITIGVIGAIARWVRFRFCIVDDKVLVRSGVLHHEELTVEFDRVQNVAIREPVYMRPFGLALLSIDTAGSGQKEIALAGISKKIAISLRDSILSRAKVQKPEGIDTPDAPGDESLLLFRDIEDIVIYGLTVNFIVWVALALGAFFGAGDLADKTFSYLGSHIQYEDVMAAAERVGGIIGAGIVFALLLLFAFMLLPLISVLGALFRHYGYRLRVEGETYRKTSGLLTRHDESMKRHKIQAAVLKQNFVARLFNRTNMQLRMASAGSGIESGHAPTGPKISFLVPALNDEELEKLTGEFLPGFQINDVQLSKINRRRFNLVIIGWTVLPPLLLVTGLLSNLVSLWFLLILPVGLSLASLILNQVWKKAGYGVVGEHGVIRHGFLGAETTIFPLYKVQRIDIRQTPGQRRKGLAHLAIHLASHSLKISYMSAQDAGDFRDLALFHVESSNRPWY